MIYEMKKSTPCLLSQLYGFSKIAYIHREDTFTIAQKAELKSLGKR